MLLAIALVAVFSFGSLASSVGRDAIDESAIDAIPVVQLPTGTVTIQGRVNINGHEAKTGATIVSNSTVWTGASSHAQIELGAFGQVEVHSLSEIVLSMSGNQVTAVMAKCGGVTETVPAGMTGVVTILQQGLDHKVKVYRGQVTVKYGQGKEKTVSAGDTDKFDDATEVIAQGDALFKVFCHEDYPIVALFALPAGLLALLNGGGGEPVLPPVLSPLNP
jgi:hypothetical protein